MAKDNVIVFPKQSKFNIAIFVLLAVFVYMVVCVYAYFSKEHIVGYEVREGTLMEDSRYKAVILREEQLITTGSAGYINYFTAQRERVGVGQLVYALDESGSIQDYIETATLSENSLDEFSLDAFRETLDEFTQNYNPQDLNELYQLDSVLQTQTQKLANNRLLKNLDNISSLNGLVKYHYATDSGNVVYWTDGLEGLVYSDVTSTLFEKKEYAVNYLSGSRLVAPGDVAYKIYNSEKWSVAFPTTDLDKANRYLEEEVVPVRFLKNDITLWGNVSLEPNSAGETVVVLDFQSGSINFADDRFLEIEIALEDQVGLKIPVSAIAQREFFLVPEEYVMYVEEESTYYINIESYMETGEKTIKKKEVSPYSLKEGKYYLDDISLTLGTRLLMANSADTYTVSEKASLTGVYNMNKGYADFKQITVKDQNESYAIVESDTMYGLNVYDYIVLNASAVSEDDFLYE